MSIEKKTYVEPASYFTKEMLEVAEKWDEEHNEDDAGEPLGEIDL